MQSASAPVPPAGLAVISAPMQPGRVVWIGVRPARRAPLAEVAVAALDPCSGLAGDHYGGRTLRTRQVTLIGTEDLAAIASFLHRGPVRPEQLRRNILVSGINLHALKGSCFHLGDALLEATGACHPCARMEEAFGPGGWHAVRGHGGITARIVAAGTVRCGDAVTVVNQPRCNNAAAAGTR